MSKLMSLTGAIALAIVATWTSAHAQTKVKIGFTPTAESLANFVAADKGYFAKHGIDAELLLLRSTAVIIPGLVSGDVQMGAVTAPVLIQAIDGGLPLVGLSGLSTYTRDFKGAAIIARPASGIKVAKDLVGKSVLTGNLNSITTIVAKNWLRAEHVDPSKVKFVEVPMPQVGDVLKSGSADAAISPDPHLFRVVESGAADIVKYVGEIVPDNTACMVNAISTDWAAKNPQAVKGIRAAVAEASKWATDNKEEALVIAAKYLQLDAALVKRSAFPPLDDTLTAAQVEWWIMALNTEKLLRTQIDVSQVMLP